MITSEQFFLDLRSALNHLYDPYFLRKSPLIRVFGLEDRPDSPVVLQRILNEGIAALEPAPGAGEVGQRRAQRRKNYELIMYRYVQQFSQDEIAEQMGLSVRHLRREQNTAIYDLAALLWDQYSLGTRPFQLADMEEEAAPQEVAASEALAGAAQEAAPQEAASEALAGAAQEWRAEQEVAAAGAEMPQAQAPLAAEQGDAADLDWLKDQPLTAPTHVAEVAAAVLELVGPLCARYNVKIENQIAQVPVPGVAVQEVALRQMLLNILSVAIRIHPGQQVTLRAETAPGAAAGEASARAAETGEANLLALAVEGPPQPGLCRPFNEDDMGSLGITARIAALYGGSLAYTPQGQPCQVVLSLPIFHQHQVLIVDDNLDFIQLVTRSLTGTHYLATGERSPRGVLDSVLRLNPDVVLLDVMMPGLDGWEVLGRLRRHPATARIPVIICTVLPQEELALSLGASGFLRKPVTPEQILSALERCSRPPQG